MSAHFDIEKDNAHFFRLFHRVFTMFAALTCGYLIVSTTAVLLHNPSSMQDWRGIACIVLTTLALLLYSIHFLKSLKMDWPPPLLYAASLWVGMYLLVIVLTLINAAFVWDFYVVYALSFGLFGGNRLLVAVSIVAITLFAFQGLLSWLPTTGALMGITSQTLMLFSVAGLIMMFQHLIEERFARNKLFKQLARTNGELEEAHRQLAQSVVQEQELAVLRERTRLAREMHDTIGHALVLIAVKLEVAQRLRTRDPARCDHELEATRQIARETMTALRASIANLRTPALEHERFDLALNRAAQAFAQRGNLHLTYLFQAQHDRLPEAIEEVLWKVCQEAFTNIEQHAHASHVQVRVSQQDETLLLHIHDDGIGLPPALYRAWSDKSVVDHDSGDHYGLRGMLERVETLDGQLTLHSSRELGTTIEVALPLS